MKILFNILLILLVFQLPCTATQLPSDEIELRLKRMFSEDIKTHKNYLWTGYNTALSFFLDERSRRALFNLGISDVQDGNLSLLSVQKVTYLGGFPYVAHAAYTNELHTDSGWIVIKHCGYVGDQEIWSRAFKMIFDVIQEGNKAPLACAVVNVQENAVWIKMMTELGFIACPELGDAEGCEGCIWFVRPVQESVGSENSNPEPAAEVLSPSSQQTDCQKQSSCLKIV